VHVLEEGHQRIAGGQRRATVTQPAQARTHRPLPSGGPSWPYVRQVLRARPELLLPCVTSFPALTGPHARNGR
jgi:hypothetical protein